MTNSDLDTPVPVVEGETYYEALAKYVGRVAALAYCHGYWNGGQSGLTDSALAVAAKKEGEEYSSHGFHDETVREYAPPLGFTREDVRVLRYIASRRNIFHGDQQVCGSLADRIEALLPPEGA